MMLRHTWIYVALEQSEKSKFKVIPRFVVGKSKYDFVNRKLQDESEQYGDIVQGNFIDHYDNLTLKTYFLFSFALKYCANADFVMKMDDDCYVNVPKLIEVYGRYKGRDLLVGHRNQEYRPFREPGYKWRVTKEEYEPSLYPDYVLGGSGYLFSRSAALKVFKVCSAEPFFKMEDIWFTGMCAIKAKVRSQHNYNFEGENVR